MNVYTMNRFPWFLKGCKILEG